MTFRHGALAPTKGGSSRRPLKEHTLQEKKIAKQ